MRKLGIQEQNPYRRPYRKTHAANCMEQDILLLVRYFAQKQRRCESGCSGFERFDRLYSHQDFYRIFFETRATSSSNLESKSLRIGDWFDSL
jgi:hypothetical protein